MPEPSLDLTTVTLTDQERNVIFSALAMTSTMLDALDDVTGSIVALELAYRILPGGLRGDES